MATADIAHERGVTRGVLLRWFVLAILIGVGLLLVTRAMDALRQPTFGGGAVVSTGGVSVEHCMQFIAIARAAYGANWKYRLDPRDTTCAVQVQEEWQHETNVRQPMTPLPSGTMTINQPTQPFGDDGSAVTVDPRVRNPETYCLNVISLARTRYGADWASRITPDEAAACGDAIRASGGR